MSGQHDDILTAATRLSRRAGLPAPLTFTPLAGGRNNRVFRIDYESAPASAVLKHYYFSEADRRDRLGAEWALLGYAWQRGIRTIPRPLAAEPESRMALYSFVRGARPAAGAIAAREVEAALDFVAALNASPRDLSAFADGSEACFSLARHLATVDRRLARLDTLDGTAPHAAAAARFVRQELAPRWRYLRHHILDAARAREIDPHALLPLADVCLSLSDFGFHNAIRRPDGTLVFLDFEYAGRDDPAKLVCDFFCQPEVPVPLEHWDMFCRRIIAGLGLAPAHRARFDLLLDAYRIKWICIILNDFLSADGARRAYADAGERSTRCESQLELARSRLRQLSAEVS